MAGLLKVGDSLVQGAISGMVDSAGLEAKRDEAALKLKSNQQTGAINTVGSAVGVLGALAVQAKRSGILNDIF